MSIFEGSLKRICDVFVDPAKINPEHLKGPSYTLQAQMFLSRGIGIQLPDPSKWEQLKKFVQIRNSIIHENAFVQKKAGKSFEGQSDKYKSVMAFKEFLTISENEESLSFTIEDISFIRRFGDGAQLLLNEIATKSIEHARAYYH